MALSKRNKDAVTQDQSSAAESTKPEFEGMGDDAAQVADTAVKTGAVVGDVLDNVQSGDPVDAGADVGHTEPDSEEEAAAATREAAKPSKEAVKENTEKALAIVKEASVSTVVTKKFIGALSEKENVFDPRSLDFNTFPRVTVGLDGFSSDAGEDYGDLIAIEVMSYNTRWVASPGVDDEEAKVHVRYSLDGKTIDSTGDDNGESLQAWVKTLKEVHGFEKASIKEYLAIYGFMTYADGAEIDPADLEIIALQVPPQSRALFERHQITMGVKISRGTVEASDIVWASQEKKVAGGKKYALINFSAKQPVVK